VLLLLKNLLLKHQLIVHSRSHKRVPKLPAMDRALFGFWTTFLAPRRLLRAAILIKPSTLLKFHSALVKKKYQLLYSARRRGKPGPKGPSWLSLLCHAKDSLWSVDIFRCESILLKSHWVMVVMDQFTRRIVGFSVRVGEVEGPGICRMFNEATSKQPYPHYLSSDNDPLCEYHRWKAPATVAVAVA